MKIVDIVWNDILHTIRNLFALMFMFGLPLLITAIFYFAFGGLSEGDDAFTPLVTRVVIANLDSPGSQYGGFSAGALLTSFLQDEQLGDILQITEVQEEAVARAMVNDRDADVAIIIPADFTTAVFQPEGTSSVVLYQDPTLTLGPSIVKGIVSQFIDGFAGMKIAFDTAQTQLAAHGIEPGEDVSREIMMAYANWAMKMGDEYKQGKAALLKVYAPNTQQQPANGNVIFITATMAAMMVFFGFFTGAAAAQSILTEEEQGTLSRLFTTPTSMATILAGKFSASVAILIVQIVVLVLTSSLIFGANWGNAAPIVLMVLGTATVAAGFGVFLMSLLKSSKQAGTIYGAVLTLTGMMGGLFTALVPGVPPVFDTLSLLVPQGWALRGWKLTLVGGKVTDVLPTVLMLALISAAFFLIGTIRFRRRFA